MSNDVEARWEYDDDQGFFCKDGIEQTQSDVLREFVTLQSLLRVTCTRLVVLQAQADIAEELTVQLAYVNVWLQVLDADWEIIKDHRSIPALHAVLDGHDRTWLEEAHKKDELITKLQKEANLAAKLLESLRVTCTNDGHKECEGCPGFGFAPNTGAACGAVYMAPKS